MIFKPLFGISKEFSGEGMAGVTDSGFLVLDDSPFSYFVPDFLLGAIENDFESLKRKVKGTVLRAKQKV